MEKITKCVVCKTTKFTFQYYSKDRMMHIPGNFSVKKCNNCSCVFLDPQPSGANLRKYYPSKRYYSYNKNDKKGLFEIIREYLIQHYYSPSFLSRAITAFIKNVPAIPSYVKHGKVLDIGCGTGDTLILLKDLGWNTYGIDMDKNAIAVGIKRGLYNLKLGIYKDIVEYPDNYFDAIRLYHVIEHLDDPSYCLSIILKKLKKNGELIIGTPNVESFISKLFKAYWYNLDSPRHLYLFSPITLKKLVEKKGFMVNKMEFCSGGGIAGSIQYYLGHILGKEINLIHKLSIVLLFYPLEWFLDKLYLGDVFVLKAIKK